MIEKEIEFKNILTKEEYNRLVKKFNINNYFSQTNNYFDTSSFDISKQKCALRVREKNDTFEFTLKVKKIDHVLEHNQFITEKEFKDLKINNVIPTGLVKDILNSLTLDINDIHYITSLTTKRAEIEYKDGLLVFDESSYSDQIDYELEYEVSDYNKGLLIFKNLLIENNIPKSNKTINKVERAFIAHNKKTT